MKEYWDKGISFEKYLKNTEETIQKLEVSDDTGMLEYHKLGLQRMTRMVQRYSPDAEQLKTLESKHFTGKVLIISESWCGDASQCLPTVSKFFEGKNEVRIVYRDENPDLMNQFLTNGAQAIPIVLLLDENYNVINHWGPRPAHGLELLKKFKENPETYPREQFYNDLQVYYAKNKGYDTIQEILNLL